jgi:hypothetical protein
MSSVEPSAAIPPVESTESAEKKKHSPRNSLIAIALALVGGTIVGWSFLTGIANKFDTTAQHSSVYLALFFVGLGILIVGIVFALYGIVRRAQLFLSVVAIVLSMLPSVVVLVVAALLFLGA